MPVYSIYISHYLRNGEHVSSETKLYDVPFTKGDPNILIDPKVKGEMGKTGTFEFSMYSNHPYYDCWKQMVTMMRVEYFGETIFYGRVLTIDVDHLTGKKSIHCEGYLAFLMDTLQEGKPDTDRSSISIVEYITQVLNTHNAMMTSIADPSSPEKTFKLGMVPGNYEGASPDQQVFTDSENIKFGDASWTDTASALSTLTKEYGGLLRARYISNSDIRLDWLDSYFRDTVSDRIIEIGTNVISLSSSTEVDNIFTVLIPVGKNLTDSKNSDAVMLNPKELCVWDIVNVYSDAELNSGYHTKEEYINSKNDYGIIYKYQNFSNADTTDKLRSYAWDWIKNNYHGGLTSFTATAIDMKIIGGDSTILVGDRVKVRYPLQNGTEQEKILTVTSAEYNLHKPDGNSYTIGIPDISLNRTYGDSVTKSSSSKSGKGKATPKGGGGRGGGGDDNDGTTKKVDHFFYGHVLNESFHNAEYKEYKDKYGDKAASSILRSSRLILDNAVDEEGTPSANKNAKQALKTMIFDAHNGTMSGFNPIDTSMYKAMSNERMSDYYSTMASVVCNVFDNKLSIRERVDATIDWVKEDYLNKGPKAILELGLAKLKGDQETSQYGTIATKFVERGSGETVNNNQTTTTTNGLNGKFVGGFMQLVNDFSNGKVPQLADDQTGTLNGTVNMNGPQAKISTTNLEDQTKETVSIEGNASSGEGAIEVGQKGSGMRIKLNKPVTYKDKDGVVHTANGFVSADDFKIDNFQDSLKVRLLVVSDLIADRATIGQLAAVEGKIDSLTANAITTQTLEGAIADIHMVRVQGIAVANKFSGWIDKRVITSITQDATTGAISVGRETIHYLGYEDI